MVSSKQKNIPTCNWIREWQLITQREKFEDLDYTIILYIKHLEEIINESQLWKTDLQNENNLGKYKHLN